MLTTAYVSQLRESRTFKCGVIEDIEEYQFNVRLGGLWRTLPPLPYANNDRHVIVLEIRGKHPSVISVLTEPNVSINPTVRDADKLVFIFLSVKSQRITISAPPNGYLLRDGQKVSAEVQLAFCITDVKQFWQSDKDPIANLESQVVNIAHKYLANLDSESLIDALDKSQRNLERVIIDSQLDSQASVSMLMGERQAEVRRREPNGIRIDQVHVMIEPPQKFQSFFVRRHSELLDPGGIKDRQFIDRRIDRDETFSPYKLRDLIKAIDSSLLEDFYSMPYSDAMRQVHKRFAEAKAEYMEHKNNAEINRLSNLVKIAETHRLDTVEELKGKLADHLSRMADSSPLDESQSNQDYVRHLLGKNKQTNQLGDSSGATTKDSE